jgi:hypothetical protein
MSTREPEFQRNYYAPLHPTKPTGDDIVADIHEMRANETNLFRVAALLTDAHAHRPGVYQQDLHKVNAALHDKGILPGMDVVGVRGEDLVARDKQGHVRLYDSKNTNYSYEDNGGDYNDKFGTNKGKFGYNADGSGIYQVAGKDNAWSIANDVLKNEGLEHPTSNQRANFIKELAEDNPDKDLAKLRPGDELTIPPGTVKLDKISPERASIAASQAYAELNTNYDGGTVALAHHSGIWGGQNYMDKNQIKAALDNPATAPVDRPGLEFLNRNFDVLKDKNGGYYNNSITEDTLAKWKADQARHIDDRKTSAFLDRVGVLTRQHD